VRLRALPQSAAVALHLLAHTQPPIVGPVHQRFEADAALAERQRPEILRAIAQHVEDDEGDVERL
jgi:hypothetical protein